MKVVQGLIVVAKKGTKQAGQIVSGERWSLITMWAIVKAEGNTGPPTFIFPRSRMHNRLILGSVLG